MKYTHDEVLDILKSITDNPEEVIEQWNINDSNTPVDIKPGAYKNFIYSFPVIVNGERVATITLANLYGTSNEFLIKKYLGYKNFENSWHTFSHDTYLDCYLTIHEEFEFPEIVDGFYAAEFKAFDAKYNEFTFTMCYGYPTNESDVESCSKFIDGEYVFFDDFRITISINSNDMQGWELGTETNKNIESRKRDLQIEKIID